MDNIRFQPPNQTKQIQANMKYLSALCCFAAFCLFVSADDEKFPSKYDDIDIEDILNNKRLLNAYGDCLLEKGTCTADGTTLKESLPDALTNKCSKCSEKQKKGVKRVLKHLIEQEVELYKKLEDKYDPQGVYRSQYKDLADKEGIVFE